MFTSWVNKKKCLVLNLLFYFGFILYFFISGDLLKYPRYPYVPGLETGQKSKVCRDVFEILRPNPKSNNFLMKAAIENIRDSKRFRNFLIEEVYAVLGDENMSILRPAEPFHGINGSNTSIPYESLLHKLNWELPYLPCRLKQYEAEDVKLCVEKRFDLGLKTRITFIGDSRIRQQMEVLLDLLHTLKLNISTAKAGYVTLDDFLGFKGKSQWAKYKAKLRVTSEDLPGFFIKFIWAPNLPKENKEDSASNTSTKPKLKKNFRRFSTSLNISNFKKDNIQNFEIGAFSELKNIASKPQEQLEDLILLEGGSWQLNTVDGILDNIDINAVHGMKKLYPLLESVASRTSVVLMLPEPFKEYALNSKKRSFNHFFNQMNSNLQWYLNAQAQLLPRSVQIWDTFVPVGYAAWNDCMDLIFLHKIDIKSLPPYTRFESISSYACFERIHLGFKNIYTSVQQLLNHLCNPVMTEKHNNFCCSE